MKIKPMERRAYRRYRRKQRIRRKRPKSLEEFVLERRMTEFPQTESNPKSAPKKSSYGRTTRQKKVAQNAG